ncbi:MAG: hypothetical protein H6739_10025 [Alphaproteobacteria bacterium]|nr:hypothetical protein [Alphaproteobacteria bacterium]
MRKPAVLIAALMLPAVALAGASASNFKKDNKAGGNLWNAQSAIDGKLETAWMVPGDSVNLGEWIMIDVPKGTVDKIAIVPGWAQSAETYSDHPRIKKLMVEVLCCADSEQMKSTATTHAVIEDKPGWQIIDIDDLEVGNDNFGGKLKLSVVEIYEGVDFPNLGISEIVIHMQEFDAVPNLSDPSDEADGHMLPDMQDGDKKTFWAAKAEGAGFTVEGNGYGLSTLTLEHGPKDYAHAKKVRLTVSGRTAEIEVPNKPGPQALTVPPIVGYTGSATDAIRVEVLEVYPGSKPEVAIAELTAKATNYDPLSAF